MRKAYHKICKHVTPMSSYKDYVIQGQTSLINMTKYICYNNAKNDLNYGHLC